MQNYLKINTNDNVAVALRPIEKGTIIETDGQKIRLLEDIPQGHKFALKNLSKNESVIKYGYSIGVTKTSIPAGTWVHVHNIKTGLGELLSYTYDKQVMNTAPTEERFFQGYRRANGTVGVRNEIWIIPTVGCVNDIAKVIERKSQTLLQGSVEAISAFSHPYGCSQMGEDQENTRRILADLINHPNAGGVLVLGLGCEYSNIHELKKYIGEYDTDRVKFLAAQESDDEVSDALLLISELADHAGKCRREPISCSELVIGLKCGGSDGLSGITANPTVGAFSDILISKGGTTILTEVPEMFGAETILMNRCKNEALFEKTVSLINDFKNYLIRHDQTIYENPSPGNKDGGISTLEDKSLGCTQKGGHSPISGVISYGEPVTEKGLNLLSCPSNDLVAATALAASGAHIILFTTGRGTPFASPVPTVKISTNSTLYRKKRNWIDFNCGTITEGDSLEELSNKLFDRVISVASGEKLKSEEAGFHDMALFKQGVTL